MSGNVETNVRPNPDDVLVKIAILTSTSSGLGRTFVSTLPDIIFPLD